MKEAYVSMTQSLEASAAEKRALEVRLGQAATDAAREARERRCAYLIDISSYVLPSYILLSPCTVQFCSMSALSLLLLEGSMVSFWHA